MVITEFNGKVETQKMYEWWDVRVRMSDVILEKKYSTEAGWMKGAGKRVVVYIPEVQEAELMYKLFDLVSGNLEEVNEYLDRMY